MQSNKLNRFLCAIFSFLIVGTLLPTVNISAEEADGIYSNVTVAEPTVGGTWGDLSAGEGRNSRISPRAVELQYQTGEYEKYNGYIFVTMEYGVPDSKYAEGETVFPVYVSADGGLTWKRNVNGADEFPDIVNRNEGNSPVVECMANCPQFFELPATIGDYPAGTVICGGIATKKDLSTSSLDIYVSTDACHSWTYTSTVATGGANYVGDNPVWEPFFLYDDGEHEGSENDHAPRLVCFYSDETDAEHSQKLVCRYTEDGNSWSDVIDVVVFEEVGQRPGMPVAAKMENGKYIMVYEGYGIVDLPNNYKFSSTDCALDWDADEVGLTFGYGGSPYVEVLDDGTIVASSAGNSNLYVNTSADGNGRWIQVASPVPNSYNRQIMKLSNGTLFVINGGWHGGDNGVICGTTRVSYTELTQAESMYLHNVASGNALCTWADSLDAGARIAQWQKGEAPHFYWQLLVVNEKTDVYKIVNPSSGRVVTANGTSEGSVISLEEDTDGDDQLWQVTETAAGYHITLAGTELALCGKPSPAGWELAEFGLYLAAADADHDEQIWLATAVQSDEKVTVSVEISGGSCEVSDSSIVIWRGTDQYFLLNPETGYLIKNVSVKSGDAILRLDSASTRYFGVQEVSSDTVILVEMEHINSEENKNTVLIGAESGNTYVCMTQNTSADGAPLIEWGLETGLGYRWTMEAVDADENLFRFVSVNGGNVLSVDRDGNIIQAFPSGSDDKQLWIVTEDEESGLYTFKNYSTGLLMTRRGGVGGQDTYPTTSKETSKLKGQLWNIEYFLLFDANGGNLNTEIMAVGKGEEIPKLPKPALSESVFSGWYTDLTAGEKLEEGDELDGSYTLYARWNYTETEDPNGDVTDGTEAVTDESTSPESSEDTDAVDVGDGDKDNDMVVFITVGAAVIAAAVIAAALLLKKRKS